MQISTKVKEFSTELAAAMGCVETHSNLPVSGLINLKAKGSDLVITSTNLDFGMRSKVPAEIKEEGSFLIDASRLNGWVSKLVYELDSEISVKQNTTRTTFKLGKTMHSLAQSDPVNFPNFPTPEENICRLPSEVLSGLLSGVLPVIEDFENARFNYSGAQLLFEANGSLTAAATNGNRLAFSTVSIPGDVKPLTCIITRKAIAELIRMGGKSKGDVVVAFSKNNLFFGFGSRQMYCRRLTDNFPGWKKILPDPSGQSVSRVSSFAAAAAISRVSSLSDKSKRIAIDFEENSISFSSASEMGESSDSILAEYVGPKVTVYANSTWILDALKAIGGLVDIAFTANPNQPLEIRPADSFRYRNIIAKMAENGESK